METILLLKIKLIPQHIETITVPMPRNYLYDLPDEIQTKIYYLTLPTVDEFKLAHRDRLGWRRIYAEALLGEVDEDGAEVERLMSDSYYYETFIINVRTNFHLQDCMSMRHDSERGHWFLKRYRCLFNLDEIVV